VYEANEGSTIEAYVIMDDCVLCRRAWGVYDDILQVGWMSEVIDRPNHVLRTGGFGELLYDGHTEEIIIEGVKHEVIIPGGFDNCMEGCIYENLKRAIGVSENGRNLAKEKLDNIRDLVRECYVERRMTHAAKSGSRKKERDFRLEFEKKVKVGYSGDMIREVRRCWMEEGVRLRVLYEAERRHYDLIQTEGKEVGARDRRAIEKAAQRLEGNWWEMVFFRITFDGEVYRRKLSIQGHDIENGKESMDYERIGMAAIDIEDEEKGGEGIGRLLHSVTIFPAIDVQKFLSRKVYRSLVMNEVEKVTRPYMKLMRDKAVGVGSKLGFESFGKVIEYQERRQKEGISQNLFFDVIGGSELVHEVAAGDMRRRGKFVVKKPLVVVYDIETVQLTKEAFDQGKVDKSLFRYLEQALEGGYQPIEKEIPYSVQWVPVNLSDEGQVREEKMRNQHRRGRAK
jgi:hypothetical protein